MEPLSHLVGANDQEPLDSEYELKRMLTFVRPLMGILRSDPRIRRSTDILRTEWVTSSRAILGIALSHCSRSPVSLPHPIAKYYESSRPSKAIDGQ